MFDNYTDTLVSLVVNAILSRQPGHASLLYFTQMPRTFVCKGFYNYHHGFPERVALSLR